MIPANSLKWLEAECIYPFLQALRASGLGYTIVRPGALVEEPGGYKALVFDQARAHLASLRFFMHFVRHWRVGMLQLREEPTYVCTIAPAPLHPAPEAFLSSIRARPADETYLSDAQGARITESISYADVADICLRALGEGEARNKTFDVCAELQGGDGLGDYELVANVRGGDNNYLAPALATLQKNT